MPQFVVGTLVGGVDFMYVFLWEGILTPATRLYCYKQVNEKQNQTKQKTPSKPY